MNNCKTCGTTCTAVGVDSPINCRDYTPKPEPRYTIEQVEAWLSRCYCSSPVIAAHTALRDPVCGLAAVTERARKEGAE